MHPNEMFDWRRHVMMACILFLVILTQPRNDATRQASNAPNSGYCSIVHRSKVSEVTQVFETALYERKHGSDDIFNIYVTPQDVSRDKLAALGYTRSLPCMFCIGPGRATCFTNPVYSEVYSFVSVTFITLDGEVSTKLFSGMGKDIVKMIIDDLNVPPIHVQKAAYA